MWREIADLSQWGLGCPLFLRVMGSTDMITGSGIHEYHQRSGDVHTPLNLSSKTLSFADYSFLGCYCSSYWGFCLKHFQYQEEKLHRMFLVHIKGYFKTKMKILSSFTHPYVITNSYLFFLWNIKGDILKCANAALYHLGSKLYKKHHKCIINAVHIISDMFWVYK